METAFPKLAADLVERLYRRWSPRCIAEGETREHAHRYAGKVELVEDLAAELAADLDAPDGKLPWMR